MGDTKNNKQSNGGNDKSEGSRDYHEYSREDLKEHYIEIPVPVAHQQPTERGSNKQSTDD